MLACHRADRIAKGAAVSYGLAQASRCYRRTTCAAEDSEVLRPGPVTVAVILCRSRIFTAWTRAKETSPHYACMRQTTMMLRLAAVNGSPFQSP